MPRNKQETMFFIYIRDFFHDMRIERKSERTAETYRESLDSFRKYLFNQHGKHVDTITIAFVSGQLVREYIGWIAENNSIGTRNIRLSALKAYVKYAAFRDLEFVPLQIGLTSVKHKTSRPKKHNWLGKDQILLILEQPKHTKIGLRDRFILLFLFSTGARLNEMLSVRVRDVVTDSKSPYIRLAGKGNKPRIVPVSDEIFIENYKYYCKLFHADIHADAYLFYTIIHGCQDKMSEDNVQRIMKKYGDQARKADSTLPAIHPHLFRHSYGAQLYRLGLSLPEIAKLLGHEDISTTEIYAETDIEMVKESLKKMIGEYPLKKWDNLSEEEKIKLLGLR